MQNVLFDTCKKFHSDESRNDRSSGNRKSDYKKNNNKNNNIGGAWKLVSGSKKCDVVVMDVLSLEEGCHLWATVFSWPDGPIFTRATHGVERVFVRATCLSVWLSGWLSVTAGIVSKQKQLAS